MGKNYNFLRSFTFDGKDTGHLFQIAKVNIPFMAKENEMMQVGNTDGKHFMNTRLTETSITIDGFLIKDNSKMNIYDTKDELVRIINTDTPKQLIFDIFPTRYFNAVYGGVQEYDATNPDYTPLTLVFDVPDGLAHSINPNGYTNVYSAGKNLILDSEYEKIDKYLKPWVDKLDERYNGSNVVSADFTQGLPVNFERPYPDDERWYTINPLTMRKISDLQVGTQVNFSIYAKVTSTDSNNSRDFAGEVVLEEWNTLKSTIVDRHVVKIPKELTSDFERYGSIIRINNPETNALNVNYGFRGNNLIKFSKPMMSLLPPLGEKVVEPIAGATLYSNSLDFGDYDYSGNPNLMMVVKASDFNLEGDTVVTDVSTNSVHVTSAGAERLNTFTSNNIPSLISGKTYTISAKVKVDEGTTGNIDKIRISYRKTNGGTILLGITTKDIEVGKEITVKGTGVVNYEVTDLSRFYLTIDTPVGAKINGGVIVSDVKIEEGSTATPYQPNLLDAPYYLSKVALGEDIKYKGTIFPIKTSAHAVYTGPNTEPYIAGQKYTVTMKATKPATQTFNVFMDAGTIGVGSMTPVSGLTDVWQKTFTVSQASIDAGVTNRLTIYQVPNSSVGAVQIDWLKVEKGDTRTPNIDYYKYRGLYTYPSTNPKDYSWTYDPSYYNAISYAPTEEGVSDAIVVNNQGTYKAYPTFTFKMKGENGLVGLIKDDGSILQFGNPEDVDGKDAVKSMEFGVNQSFWGNTLNPDIVVNKDFTSVWNPTPPNEVRGSWDMTTNVNSVTPHYAGVSDIGVWHGPTMMMDILPPYNNDRNNEVEARMAFMFDNDVKYRRGRYEFSSFDENNHPIMTTIISDSNAVSNTIQFEVWYKGVKLDDISLNKGQFSGREYEIVMLRRGNKLQWNMMKVHTTERAKYDNTTYAQVIADTVRSFNWTLDANDTTKWMKVGVWAQRYSDKPVTIQVIRHIQVRWLNTKYYQDIRNYFQDGDIVDIDVENRQLLVNGTINNDLNVVGNQWEKFILPVGTTILQPVVSTWAEMAEVTAVVRERWL